MLVSLQKLISAILCTVDSGVLCVAWLQAEGRRTRAPAETQEVAVDRVLENSEHESPSSPEREFIPMLL